MIVAGSLWAHQSWGRYWAWDPIETSALAHWIALRRDPALPHPARLERPAHGLVDVRGPRHDGVTLYVVVLVTPTIHNFYMVGEALRRACGTAGGARALAGRLRGPAPALGAREQRRARLQRGRRRGVPDERRLALGAVAGARRSAACSSLIDLKRAAALALERGRVARDARRREPARTACSRSARASAGAIRTAPRARDARRAGLRGRHVDGVGAGSRGRGWKVQKGRTRESEYLEPKGFRPGPLEGPRAALSTPAQAGGAE